MKAFTDLYLRLDESTRTSAKVDALSDYFRTAPPRDAAWAVYVLSGRKIGRSVSSRLLRELVTEASGYPGWLVDESYHVVGDLSETLSLLVPIGPQAPEPPPLHEIIEHRIKPLASVTQGTQRQLILATWAQLNTEQRFVFHKLLAGEFRVGVSRQLLIRAIAQVAGVEPALIAHRLAGNWIPDDQTMARLLGGAEGGTTDPGMPYPFMLAHPLHEPLESIGPIADWLVEWKWDGIRAQIIRRAGRTTLWSRGDEVVTATFPEITQAATSLPDGTVLDGEIVAWDEAAGRPQPFTKLQRRLNRKSFEMTFWPENPVTFIAFDALEIEGADVRGRPLRERRELLTWVVKAVHPTTALRLSEPAVHETWDAVSAVM
ncbi:MAG: ligase, ATP-dependent [Phycisphaerales bacterium]|nr:ligase, ATP-dependent [Phycisphaerales bacterium]